MTAGADFEFIAKTILEADASSELAVLAEVNAAIEEIGASAAKVSTGSGGNYSLLVKQSAEVAANLQAAAAAIKEARPAAATQLETLAAAVPGRVSQNIQNPTTSAGFVSRVQSQIPAAEERVVAALRNQARSIEAETVPVARLGGVAGKAQATGTLDAFKTIHESARGIDETASVADSLGLSSVTQAQVINASRRIQEASQKALANEADLIKVYRQPTANDQGVVSASTKPLTTFPDAQEYTVLKEDILTYGEALQKGTFAEGEVQVLSSKLRNSMGALIVAQDKLAGETYYQGTTSKRIPSIEEQGLVPGAFGAVHATPNFESALAFANDRVGLEGGKPAVVAFKNPGTDDFHAGVPADKLTTVDLGALNREQALRAADERLAALEGDTAAIQESAAEEKTTTRRTSRAKTTRADAEEKAATETVTEPKPLYHGTNSTAAKDILKHGFESGDVFATEDPVLAKYYADQRAATYGGKPTVLTFPTPPSTTFSTTLGKAEEAQVHSDDIPVESIRRLNINKLAALERQTVAIDASTAETTQATARGKARDAEVDAAKGEQAGAAGEQAGATATGGGKRPPPPPGGRPPTGTPPEEPPPEDPIARGAPRARAVSNDPEALQALDALIAAQTRLEELDRAVAAGQLTESEAYSETTVALRTAISAQERYDAALAGTAGAVDTAADKTARESRRHESLQGALADTPPIPGAANLTSDEQTLLSKDLSKALSAAKVAVARNTEGFGYADAIAEYRLALQQASAAIAQTLATGNGVNVEQGAYAKALAETRIAQARTNADVNIMLANTKEYSASLAENKAAQLRAKASTEELLAADRSYITATAEVANARRTIAALSKTEQLNGAGFEKTRATGVILPPTNDETINAERRAEGVKQITQLEGATQALTQYRKLQTDLVQQTERQLISARAAAPGGSGETEAVLVTQRKTIEATLNAQLERQLAGSKEYQDATVELSAAKKLRAAQEKAALNEELAGNQAYILATAEAANARRLQAERIKEQEAAGVGLGTKSGLILPSGNPATAEQIAAAQAADLQAYRELTASNLHNAELAKARLQLEQQKLTYTEQEAAELAEAAIGQKRYNEVQRLQIAAAQRAAYEQNKALVAVGGGDKSLVGTGFQRFQATLAGRGDAGGFKDPLQYAQLGQFLKSKFLTTAGFAVSGIATYAAFSGIQKMVTDSAALEKELQQIRAEFQALGDSGNFASFRAGILGISRDTGEAAGDVAKLALQFKGAFGASLDDAQILGQVRSAVELARVTGISLDEITNNLTGTAVTYGTTVQHVGDVVLTLQDRTGVAAKESIQALSDMAVAAQDAGATLEQAGSIAAVAAKYTGQSGASVAEGLNRIFPALQGKAGQIIQLFSQVDPSKVAAATSDLASGKTFAVFDLLGKSYNQLSKSQQEYLVSLLGSRRDAKTAIDVFQHYGEVLGDVGAAQSSNGRLEKSYAALQQTLSQQIARLTASFKNIGQVLLSLGISDIVQELAKAIGLLVGAVSAVLQLFSGLNNALGGVPAKLAEITVASIALYKIMKLIEEAGFFSAVAKGAALVPGSAAIKNVTRTAAGAEAAGGTAVAGAAATGAATTPVAPVVVREVGTVETAVNNTVGAFGTRLKTASAKLATDSSKIFEPMQSKLSIAGENATNVVSKIGVGMGTALEGLGAALTTFAPLIAIVSVTAAINAYTHAKSSVDKAQQAYSAKLGTLTTPELLKAQVPGTEHGFGSPSGAVDIVGRAIFGKKTAYQYQQDEIQKRLSTFDAQGLLKLTGDTKNSNVPGGFEDILQQFNAQQLPGVKKIDDKTLVDLSKNGTTSDSEFKSIQKLIAFAKTKNKNLGGYIQALLDGNDKTIKDAQTSAKGLTDLPTLQIQAETGTITPQQFTSQAVEIRNATIRTLDIAIKTHAPQDVIQSLKQQLDAQNSALSQVLDKRLQDLAAGGQIAANIRGDSQESLNALIIRSNTAALSIPDALRSSQAPVLAQGIVTAQHAQLQFMADHAATAAEAQDILAKGLKIPAAAQAALNLDSLRSLPDDVQQVLSSTALAVGDDVQSAFIAIANTKGGLKAGLQKYVEKLIAAKAALKKSGDGDSKQFQRDAQHLRDVRALIASGLFDLPTDVTNQGPVASTRQQNNEALAAYTRAAAGTNQLGGLQADQTAALQGVQEAAAAGGNKADKINAATKLITAELALKQYMVDHARSTAEAARIFATPIAFGPALQQEQFETKLPKDSSNALKESASLLGHSYDSVLKDLIRAKGGIKAGIEALVVRLSAMLRNLVRLGDGAGIEAKNIRQALSDLQAQSANIEGAGPTDPGTKLQRPVSTLAENQDALYNLRTANAGQDPLKIAEVARSKAQNDYNRALALGDKATIANTKAALITAQQQVQTEIDNISDAQIGVLTALADGDPIKAAQAAQAAAHNQAAHAHGQAQQLAAYAAEISADHQLRDAMFAIIDAQTSLLIAMDNAAGDTVKAARDALSGAQGVLARDLGRGLDPNSAQVLGDRQKVVEAQAALRDATLQHSEDDINFLLTTQKISNGQAIARLKVLDANSKLTEAEHHQLEEQIFSLQHQNNQDLQFNLPSDIQLPTLYEARRFNQTGGGSSYQDNRHIEITITTNHKMEPKEILAHVTDAINAPPRNSTRRGVY